MSCERMESRILEYMDGRLKESERAEVEKHLADCHACSVRAHEFRSVSNLLDELPAIEPSPAFDVRVRARIAAEPVKQSWWAQWASLRPSPRIAFAASMLLLATVWIGRQSSPPPQVAQEDIPVIENYDVLSSFEPLSELPPPVQPDEASQSQEN